MDSISIMVIFSENITSFELVPSFYYADSYVVLVHQLIIYDHHYLFKKIGGKADFDQNQWTIIVPQCGEYRPGILG